MKKHFDHSVLLIILLAGPLLAACSTSQPAAAPSESDPGAGDPPADTAVPALTDVAPQDCAPTPADGEGPYYLPNAPFTESIAPDDLPGDRLVVSGTVFAGDCLTRLADAVVDVWQADADGVYDFSEAFILRGRVTTDLNGEYSFQTILPGYYGDGGNVRPLHIHAKISHPEFGSLTTQIYFADDPYSEGASPAVRIRLTEQDGILYGIFDVVLGS